jgi:RNA polymerase sigma-70 factor (ECF subfamily)
LNSDHPSQRRSRLLVPPKKKAERSAAAAVGNVEVACYEGNVLEKDERQDSAVARSALAYADGLFNLARYLTGNDSDADDLVQETYTRAFARSRQFHGGNLKAWLFKILRNAFVDSYRKEKHNPERGGLDTVNPTVEPPAEVDLLRDDLEIHQLRNVVAADIETALMKLTEEARTVVLLDLEGLSEVEVAEVLGCAIGTVKSRLSRARLALRQYLKGYAR